MDDIPSDEIGFGHPISCAANKKKLVINGPFQYCRNPNTLGTILAYPGISIFLGSFSIFFIVVFLASLLIIYLKWIEEKELEDRFGKDYVEYKQEVPFLIPKNLR